MACYVAWKMLGRVAIDDPLVQQILLSVQDLGCASLKIVSMGLMSSAEMIIQELLANGIECDLVGRASESVTLIREQDVSDWNLPRHHGVNDLIRLGLLHTRIVGTLTDKQGLFDFIDVSQRGALKEELSSLFSSRISANSEDQHPIHGTPVGWDSLNKSNQVTGTNNIHTTTEHIRSIG